INVNTPISWADEERDTTAWIGNELQVAAIDKLYSLADKVKKCEDNDNIRLNWAYLQTSDHFYYMATKFFSDGEVHKYFNPYNTPYDAVINYMNVLSDFEIQLKRLVPSSTEEQIHKLERELDEKTEIIKELKQEIEEKNKAAKKTKKTSTTTTKEQKSTSKTKTKK
ncbi:MAG: alpha-amylase, partial [Bacteroidales bacterium]|nr:alpha-amylase [Bacteroidales bacterium]